jgi:uncharacterized protein YcgL (UPF0745 family)
MHGRPNHVLLLLLKGRKRAVVGIQDVEFRVQGLGFDF